MKAYYFVLMVNKVGLVCYYAVIADVTIDIIVCHDIMVCYFLFYYCC